jgi:hypothetical protein
LLGKGWIFGWRRLVRLGHKSHFCEPSQSYLTKRRKERWRRCLQPKRFLPFEFSVYKVSLQRCRGRRELCLKSTRRSPPAARSIRSKSRKRDERRNRFVRGLSLFSRSIRTNRTGRNNHARVSRLPRRVRLGLGSPVWPCVRLA